ncbi:uncharacterized protein UV8b_04954 [Ustilaginoidea virens]|uniref:CMP/dCMP-type deaminase domain-containing protein n=1 Tax=Ustilaginoidea virens TaxID=1159556 RepID=A0A8E5HSJ1_USTVR|nr:uncharacterized protein UV8b_04954 [Ustilaginoidea virens]QUC20713.1 hypothetical protein UV8b_04954 [Ustilaginoidea virens]
MLATRLAAAAAAAAAALALGQAGPAAHDAVPLATTRNYWMRRANRALDQVRHTPCPFNAFGSVIVNHSAPGLGHLICMGANDIASGDPTLHGEIAAINNCSALLTDPRGPYKLTGAEAQRAWADLTLYTNAEPCPMCASAIRWAGFKELVYGTSTKTLARLGWSSITLSAEELFSYARGLRPQTALLGGVLDGETDRYFAWQFDGAAACPRGCARVDKTCVKRELGERETDAVDENAMDGNAMDEKVMDEMRGLDMPTERSW